LTARQKSEEFTKILPLPIKSSKDTYPVSESFTQKQPLDAMDTKRQLTSGKTQCKTCGAYWGTTGHNNKCPQKVYTLEGKFCDCGEPATTTSAVSSRPDPVCQRCHDCEKANQRNFGKRTDSIAHTYAVRLSSCGGKE
jgi:hypothetical protein